MRQTRGLQGLAGAVRPSGCATATSDPLASLANLPLTPSSPGEQSHPQLTSHHHAPPQQSQSNGRRVACPRLCGSADLLLSLPCSYPYFAVVSRDGKPIFEEWFDSRYAAESIDQAEPKDDLRLDPLPPPPPLVFHLAPALSLLPPPSAWALLNLRRHRML